MRVVLMIIATLAALVCGVLLIGVLLPRKHIASRAIVVRRTPREVYSVARDFASASTWRPDLKQTEMLGEVEGRLRFREHSAHGQITYELLQEVPNEKLVTRIVDRDLGYFGSWTYDFIATTTGTQLRITEHGEVPNVLFRFMSRFVVGHTATMDNYLKALGRKFGEELTPN